MKTYSSIALASLAFAALAQPAAAQSNTTAEPACILKNADGTETVGRCPEGLQQMGASTEGDTAPASDTTASEWAVTAPKANTTANTTQDQATAPDTTASTTQDQATAPDTTASTTPAPSLSNDVIVPTEMLQNARVMTASDFIGKRVYTRQGEDIGEVNDLIVTDNGSVQAVILGVGGFLGLGEKDVAVSMRSIEVQSDGNSAKLVVDASKDQLTNAPGYDRQKRTYYN